MSEHLWWYVARASGMVAWLLLTTSVLWGIWLSTRQRGSNPRPNWILDLHRWLGGLAVTFTGVHLLGLFLDGYVGFSVADLFVPFASSWHPTAVAWGIVAFYGLIAVELTSLMRSHMPRRAWHVIHLTSYVLFWVASVHGVAAGSDTGSPLFPFFALTGMAAVALGTIRRLRLPPSQPPAARRRSSSAYDDVIRRDVRSR